MFNGKKVTTEKALLKTIKELGWMSKMHLKNIIKSYFLLLFPIFKVSTNEKKTSSTIVWSQKIRVSSVIKSFISILKNKTSNHLYLKICKEIFEINPTNSNILELKNKTQKQVLAMKNFFFFYKWK